MPVDAERWLAERGVRRDPIRVTPPADTQAPPADPPDAAPAAGVDDRQVGDATDTADAADAAGADAVGDVTDAADAVDAADADAVGDALAFLRRSTAVAPQAEVRLRTKLVERGVDEEVVDAAMVRARAERIVDDAALAAALVDERRRKGHSASRIRRDLRARGFDDETLEQPLAVFADEDPEARAFALARARAEQLGAVEPEAAFRRIVGYLLRRGHPDGLSRKVARDAVFADREDHRI